MKTLYGLGLIALTAVLTFSAFAEEMTLSTYYPAPFGVYREMRANQMSIGSGYRNETLTDGELFIEGNVGIGTTTPLSYLQIGPTANVISLGTWTDLVDGVCPAGTTGIDRDNSGFLDNGECQTGKVGIGMTNPEASLQVNGTMKIFGDWESETNDTVHQALTDGFVIAIVREQYQRYFTLTGYTDSANPPTTIRAERRYYVDEGSEGSDNYYDSITMPVRKGDYWKVTGADTVYWIPLGN